MYPYILIFRADQINDEILIYHILLTLQPVYGQSWELIFDFTHTGGDNRFKVDGTCFLSYFTSCFYFMNALIFYVVIFDNSTLVPIALLPSFIAKEQLDDSIFRSLAMQSLNEA